MSPRCGRCGRPVSQQDKPSVAGAMWFECGRCARLASEDGPGIKLVYVAGRYSDDDRDIVRYNTRIASIRGDQVSRLGAMPVVPHAIGCMCTEVDRGCEAAFDWYAGTLSLMRRCDAVMLAQRDADDHSQGTRREVVEAERLGIPVFRELDELAQWLEREDDDRRRVRAEQ